MKVVKEVELSDGEINDLIVRHAYKKARDEFYRYGNDHYDFGTYDGWRRKKYEEARQLEQELLQIDKWDRL